MLVGVTGYAQHGKDTIANYLVSKYGFARLAFADGLKQLAYEVDPNIPGIGRLQSIVDTEGWEKAKQWPEVRRILQVLGTSARDIIGPHVWIQAVEAAMLRVPTAENYVISDVRFPNEAEFVRRWNGSLWRVHRLNEDGTAYDNGIGTEHPSEASVAELMPNNLIVARTMQEIYMAVDDIMGVTVGG